MTFIETMEHVATGVELLGVGVLVVGIAWSAVRAAIGWVRTWELQIEIDGTLPWRRSRRDAGVIPGASPRGVVTSQVCAA